MSAALDPLFDPSSIAVIGASNKPEHAGYAVMTNLRNAGFDGPVYAVNPNRKRVLGAKSYSSLAAIKNTIDLAVIATPARTVIPVVREGLAKGVRAFVVITAGFQEAGPDGIRLQRELMREVRGKARILGPNCLGYIRPDRGINVTFAKTPANPGSVAFISQSGALCSAILDWARGQGIGFRYFMSVGDMADVDFADILDYLDHDDAVTSILLYMESLPNAAKFLGTAGRVSAKKPVVVYKSGVSSAGSAAARTHTGSISGSDNAFDAAFERSGIIRVRSVHALFDAAEALARHVQPEGNRLAIITNAGGPGVIATDALVAEGGVPTELSSSVRKRLTEHFPYLPDGAVRNPFDLLGNAGANEYGKALEILLQEPAADGILTIVTPQTMTDIPSVARIIGDAAATAVKPIISVFMGDESVKAGKKLLESRGCAVYETPEAGVSAFLIMHRYRTARQTVKPETEEPPLPYAVDRKNVERILSVIRKHHRSVLTEPEAKSVLRLYGIPVPEFRFVRTPYQAETAAAAIGFPVALKIVSPDILHKTDAGGQAMNIRTVRELHAAYDRMIPSCKAYSPNAWIQGVLVERMDARKFELIIGSTRDPVFGPVVVFGTGGTAVEVYKDTGTDLVPMTPERAERLIDRTKISALLRGYRGQEGAKIDSITDIIVRLSLLLTDFPEIREVDMNPVAADETGAVVLDAKMVIAG